MIRDLLSAILFRKYAFRASGRDYVLRISRLRLYYRGERALALRDYAQHAIDYERMPHLPPGCKVFIVV